MLGDLPLALAQLAATRKATGMALARYLDLFERHVHDLMRAGRAPYYPASLGATVTMSIERLDSRSPVLLLIELFAHFGPDPVPSALLRNGRHAAVTDVLKRCIDDSQQLRASLDEIARLGLVKVETDGRHAVAHRLVRLALRENLSAESLEPRSGEHPRVAGRSRSRHAGDAVELARPRDADPARPAVRAGRLHTPRMLARPFSTRSDTSTRSGTTSAAGPSRRRRSRVGARRPSSAPSTSRPCAPCGSSRTRSGYSGRFTDARNSTNRS